MQELVFIEPNCAKTSAERCPNGMKRVYVIESDNGYIKIGVSCDYAKRKRAIETQSGNSIKRDCYTYPLSNAYHIESVIHKIMNEKRVSGEWFNAKYEYVVSELKGICASIANTVEPEIYPISEFKFIIDDMKMLKNEDLELYNFYIINGLEIYWNGNEYIVKSKEGWELSEKVFMYVHVLMHKASGR